MVSVIVIRGMSLLAFSQVIYLAKVTRESPAGSRGLKVPTNKLSLKFEVKVYIRISDGISNFLICVFFSVTNKHV